MSVLNPITRFLIVAAAAAHALAFAQQQPQQQEPPAPAADTSNRKVLKVFRRFTIGGAVSFQGLTFMEKGSTETTLSTSTTFKSTSENLGNRFGFGPILEFDFAKRWGIASGLGFRTGDYRLTNDTTVSTTVSSVTTTKVTTVKERTSFHSWEVPLLVRRFSKEHDEAGFRWFYQAGLASRRITHIRTERSTTTPDSKVACCDESPAAPHHGTALGVVAGAGLRSRDQFGIRVTPEIRYTRWMQRNWDELTARSKRDQVELVLGFTF